MEFFKEYLETITDDIHRKKLTEILSYIFDNFKELEPRIAWSQPIFTDHSTFIIGFSLAKKHLSLAPEKAAIRKFSDEATLLGYGIGKETITVPWGIPFDYQLLKNIIEFNVADKKDCTTFWRK